MKYILVWRLAGPWQKPPGVARWRQRQFAGSEGSGKHLGNPKCSKLNPLFSFFSTVTQTRSYAQSCLPSNTGRVQPCRPSVCASFSLPLLVFLTPLCSTFSLFPFSSVISIHLCLSLCGWISLSLLQDKEESRLPHCLGPGLTGIGL